MQGNFKGKWIEVSILKVTNQKYFIKRVKLLTDTVFRKPVVSAKTVMDHYRRPYSVRCNDLKKFTEIL